MNTSGSRSSKVASRHALAIVAIASALGIGGLQARETTLPDSPSGQLYVSPSQVRLVQEKLREQGRTTQVDGVWGNQTTAEVRAFQRSKGLAPTGQLDTSLLSALEIGDVLEGETASGFLDGLLRTDKAAAEASKGQGAALYVSPVHVAQIQHVLQTQGFYSGQIDGMWGANTARAADRYRAEHGLEASPGLDIALLRDLNQQKTSMPKVPELATSRTRGVPLHAGAEAIRVLQRELSQKGHEAGAVDGVWGENTRAALRDYQRVKGLETTGTLTLPTLAALGIDVASKKVGKTAGNAD